MRLPPFSYFQPATVEEAVALAAANPGARLMAGGTDLLVNMKHRVESPQVVLGLSRVAGLQGICEEQDATVVGACTTLKEIQKDETLTRRYPALVQAASSVGSYRHQTMGTLGGNLCQNTRCRFFNQSEQWRQARTRCYKAGGEDCHVMNKKAVCYSTYSGDVAPALLVLGAALRLSGPEGSREIPLAELYSREGASPLALSAAEVVTAVVIPAAAAVGGSRYEKHSLRGSIDFPIVGAAVWRGNGSWRVAYTGVDRAPVRATALEAALEGRELSEETLREVAPLATKAATLTRTTVHSVPIKRELMGALFVRAASALLSPETAD